MHCLSDSNSGGRKKSPEQASGRKLIQPKVKIKRKKTIKSFLQNKKISMLLEENLPHS